MRYPFCESCGAKAHLPDARFCGRCGAPLTGSQAGLRDSQPDFARLERFKDRVNRFNAAARAFRAKLWRLLGVLVVFLVVWAAISYAMFGEYVAIPTAIDLIIHGHK